MSEMIEYVCVNQCRDGLKSALLGYRITVCPYCGGPVEEVTEAVRIVRRRRI